MSMRMQQLRTVQQYKREIIYAVMCSCILASAFIFSNSMGKEKIQDEPRASTDCVPITQYLSFLASRSLPTFRNPYEGADLKQLALGALPKKQISIMHGVI